MNRFARLITAALVAVAASKATPARADDACLPVKRGTLARCAIDASPVVRVGAAERDLAGARVRVAAPWLPSNPVLGLSAAARRNDTEPRATNWYASLSQELEIGGQRAARVASAEADVAATEQRALAARRGVAITAFRAYFEAVAARDELALARRLEALTRAVADTTQTFAERGAIAGLDADLADAVAARAKQGRIGAEGRAATARTVLAALLAVPVERVEVEGDLAPLRDVVDRARRASVAGRPELRALEWEARAHDARSRQYERQRIPNPTVSAFLQNDGFNERVFGLGLSLPLPVGRTYAGEIAEARASARLLRTESTRVEAELGRELAAALGEFDTRIAERDAITDEKYARAETTLTTLAGEVSAGKIAPRDAFLAQQTLIELLQGRVAARRLVCLASLDVARAAGLMPEGGEP